MRAHTSLPLPSSVSQIDGLQALRAVAVILVAWLHTSDYLHLTGAPRLPNLGVFGVDIFFVISGFILSSVVMRERARPGITTMWRFLRRRLVRIYPVYWIFAIFAMARLLHAHQLFAQNYVPAIFLFPAWQYPGFPILHAFSWTLVFEMFFYALLSLVLLYTIRFAPQVLIFILCVFVGGGAISDIRRPIWIVFCNPILLEFVLGAVIAVAYRTTGKRRGPGRVLTLCGIVLAVSLASRDLPGVANGLQMIITNVGVFERVATYGVAAFLLVGGVVLWSPSMERPMGRLLVILGNASYSTYLISGVAVEIALRVMAAVHVPHSVPTAFLYASLCIAFILGIGWAFYDLVEWPLLRFLQRKLSL